MSRLTFRDPAGDVAWQRQLREHYADEGVPPVPHLDVGKARVRAVSREIAERIILKYEWLGTLPAGVTHYYGIFFGMHCAGVTCVSISSGGANVNAHKEWQVEREEMAYLARGACVHWAPPNTNSKLVSWTCRLLERETDAKIAIAYVDTDAGEIGTIYQAANWTCVGQGSATRQWIAPNGKVYDQKHPSNLKARKGGTRQGWVKALRKAGWVQQTSNPKYRYVYVLDRQDERLLSLVESKRVPYPKREDLFDDAPAASG